MYRKTGIIFVALFLVLTIPFSKSNAAGETVDVWLTTPDQTKLLTQGTSLKFSTESNTEALVITVDESIKYQQMDGWGASITDSSALLMWDKLSAETRNTLMKELFDKKSGIGLSFLRQPMGASDFSGNGNYSYDDGTADPKLENFSIKYDRRHTIPLLQQALKINPSIKIMGTPWSPPGWMKTGGSMVGGTILPEHYSTLASYFVKYIQAYEAQGIPIYAITAQNEPLFNPPGYPGMKMQATEQRDFIKNNLGPALAAAGLHTKIMIYDHNWDRPDYPITIFEDAKAASYVAGVAWHCYGGDITAQLKVHEQYPKMETWQTECSGGAWSPVFARNIQQQTELLVILNARYWGKSGVTWNMALDTDGGPKNGGCKDCRGVVTIDPRTGTYTKEVEYYSLGHASKFVDSGAYRVESNNFSTIENVAFQNPDGSLVVVALNSDMLEKSFQVKWHDQTFTYTLPAYAVATFKWSGTP